VLNGQGLGIEANLMQSIGRQVKGLKNVFMTHGGNHYHMVLQMDPPNNGMAKNAIMAAFAAFSDLQMVTVVNSDVDIYNPADVEFAMATRMDPVTDIVIIPGAFGHELNPVVKGNVGAKVGFDCTCPVPRSSEYTRLSFKNVDIGKYEIS